MLSFLQKKPMRINGERLSFFYLMGVLIIGLMIIIGLLIRMWLGN